MFPDSGTTGIPCLMDNGKQRRWNETTRQLEWQARRSGSKRRGDGVTSTILQCHQKREPPREGEKLISYWQEKGRREKEKTQALMKQLRDMLQDAHDRAKGESRPQEKKRLNDNSSKIQRGMEVSNTNVELPKGINQLKNFIKINNKCLSLISSYFLY